MAKQFLQLKITLKGIKPPIWRRVIVPNDLTLKQLHVIIISAMGWNGGHLHQFYIHNEFYGDPSDDIFGDGDIQDEQQFILSEFLTAEKSKIHYEYDFGDSWEHEIFVEKILPTAENHPICIKGKRACPPDDVGGIYGYAEFLKIIADPEHPDYEDTLDWIGFDFDAEEFDIDDVNYLLSKLTFFKT